MTAINFKIYDGSTWEISYYNTHIAQYLKKVKEIKQ